jgi:hypothetical protein
MTNIRIHIVFAPYTFTNCISVQANISTIYSVQMKTNMTYSDLVGLTKFTSRIKEQATRPFFNMMMMSDLVYLCVSIQYSVVK